MAKTDTHAKLLVEERAAEEREKSDKLYAIKLVETIVFTIVGAAGLAALYALLKIVIIAPMLPTATPIP
jgi:hypothetical protein